MQLVNLHKASVCVAGKRPFDANQCFARWVQQVVQNLELSVHDEVLSTISERRNYIVYSGHADTALPLPLFVYDEFAAAWFENTDMLYGGITTKQRKRLRPAAEVHRHDDLTVRAIARFGYAHVAKLRLERKGKRPWQDELRAFMSRYGGTVTGRTFSSRYTPEELLAQWRVKHVRNGGPSMNQIWDELVKLKSGGKIP